MKKILLAVIVAISLILPAAPAAAFNPLGSACATGGAHGSTACQTGNTDPITGQNGTLRKVTRLIALFAGFIAVIIIIISALQFITAQGDAKGVADARRNLIGALVGLVIIATAEGILTFVLNKV